MPDDEEHQKTIHRLRRLEGQIRGLERMVTENKDCEEILIQLLAAKAALNKVGVQIITHTMKDCIAAKDPDRPADEVISDAMDIFTKYVEAIK